MEDLEQTLARLIQVAVANVPGADYGGITMTEDGTLVSRAPSDPRIAELDALQAELAEGPCVTAQASGTSSMVQVEDFADEYRWPRFAPAAAGAGIGSLMSFAMAPHGVPPGAVNLYSTRRAGFGHLDRVLGEAFALHVGVAVYGARTVANLRRALDTRDTIGQAKGILMERFDLSADEAFELLVGSSQETNTKLHDVATWLATERGAAPGPPGGPAPRPGSACAGWPAPLLNRPALRLSACARRPVPASGPYAGRPGTRPSVR